MRDHNPRIRWVLLGFTLIITVAVILWGRSSHSFFEPFIVWVSAVVLVFSILAPESNRLGGWFNAIIFVSSLGWFIYDFILGTHVVNIEALIAVFFSFGVLAFSLFAPKQLFVTPQMLRAARDSKKRKELIVRVRDIWINGVLASEQKDRPVMPTRLKLVYPESSRLITYADLDAALREAFGRLLLVGEPGSGKTFASLQLTQSLLEEAEQDEDAPVPLIFLLGNWGQGKLSVEEWLLTEMESLYKINKEMGQAWLIDGKRSVWLLDGLDQVAEDLRRKCVSAMNVFCEAHPDTSILICSRLGEFQALERRPNLNRVIELVPLTSEQVRSYIELLQLDETDLQSHLVSDSQFSELAQNRFMLSLMCDAEIDLTKIGLHAPLTQVELRRQILGSYVDSSFQRYAKNIRYSQDYLRKGLSWLARNMRRHQQSIFLIERIQPNWLPEFVSKTFYRVLLSLTLVSGWVIYSIGAGIIETTIIIWWLITSTPMQCLDNDPCLTNLSNQILLFAIVTPIMTGVMGLMGGVSFAVPFGLASHSTVPFEDWDFSIPSLLKGGALGIVIGLIITPLMSTAWYLDKSSIPFDAMKESITQIFGAASLNSTTYSLFVIVCYGIVFVLTGSLIAGTLYSLALLAKRMRPSFQELSRWTIVGSLIGLLSGLVGSAIGDYQEVLGSSISSRLFAVPIAFGMVVSAIMAGFSIKLDAGPERKKQRPNLGIWQSTARSATIMAISVLVAIVFIQLLLPLSLLGNSENLASSMTSDSDLADLVIIVYVLRLMLLAMLPSAFGFMYGGLAVVQHLSIRVVLAIVGYMPMRIVRFLEDACNLGILQRVGGGYQFRHPLFLEYFADLYAKR